MCVCVCCVSALLKYLNVCVCSVSAFLKCYYVRVCGVSAFSFFYVVRVCSVSADKMQTTVVCGQGCLCPFNSGVKCTSKIKLVNNFPDIDFFFVLLTITE